MRKKIKWAAGFVLFTGLLFIGLISLTRLAAAVERPESAKAAGREPWSDFKFQPAGPNLAGFPACSFTRPFGFKMNSFGHTTATGNIDNNAEGSACPVGGLGAPGFEWTISGNFRYWFLKSGWYVDDNLPADAFHVYLKKGRQTIVRTIATDRPASVLQSWPYLGATGQADYYALYPRSGISLERMKDWPVKLAVVQFSPVIPHNYKESSYPVAIYKWLARNTSSEPVEVSIMLTWENMVGWEAYWPGGMVPATQFVWDKKSGGNYSEFMADGQKQGIIFRGQGLDVRRDSGLVGTMAIATWQVPGSEVTYLTDFDPTGDGREVMGPFSSSGRLPSKEAGSSKNSRVASALCLSLKLRPGQQLEIPFVISWDFPYDEFEKGVKYRKKYTEFFGSDGQRAMNIAFEALDKYQEWEKAIVSWQKGIVDRKDWPPWFKQLLFNELYVLSETSLWEATTDLFTYLESADYLMYGTFDVDSYCWQILELWPELEMRNIRFFAEALNQFDPAYKIYQYNETYPNEVPASKKGYYWNINKEKGMIPHDLGSPRVRPLVVLNAFDWQNGNVWKDLNPKFPLRALRDYLASGRQDIDLLAELMSASVLALDTLEKKFGDPVSHLPQNEGIPDQTYDTWRMKGTSAYVGLLWLSSLQAANRMGKLLLASGVEEIGRQKIKDIRKRYEQWIEAGRKDLAGLWDSERHYFHIDAETDDIMTDQLFGLWYGAMIGLNKPEPLFPVEQVKACLQTIFKNNVAGYGDGLMGAVNGRRSDGSQLLSQQGDEVWVGTAYAFAANCFLHGLKKEGWQTIYGLYRVVWSPEGQGYFFKTPEAYLNPDEKLWNDPAKNYGENLFRAMKYMRPGAVWAVYRSLLSSEAR
jgi:non-lysosomal glucosylceramidase